MAELLVEGDDLVVHLSAAERVEAIRGQITVPRSSVRGVEVLEDAIHAVKGLRSPGMKVGAIAAVGTFHDHKRSIFVAVHHNTPRGLRILLDDAPYDELIIGCADPEGCAESFL